MLTLLLLFALQVASPGELACVGSIQEMSVPEDVFIAGLSEEGTATVASPGRIVYLNGPGVASLKPGSVQRVIRPEGKVHDPSSQRKLGVYYKDIGLIRIESVNQEHAAARVLATCEGMLKGDIAIPGASREAVHFNGSLSDALTQLPAGLSSSILMGKNDARQLAAGHFCFIKAGKLQGVKPGDRFTIYRQHPAFNQKDMILAQGAADAIYAPIRGGWHDYKVDSALRERALPPKVLGDMVIVEVGESVSTGRIINSMSEISPGDLVVRR